MKYLYKTTAEALKASFSDLLEIDEYDQRNLVEITDEKDELGGFDLVPAEFLFLSRKSQREDKPVKVNIKTMSDVMILLDYLSTSNRGWDYEPQVEINVPIGRGRQILFHGRGNYGHLDNLKDNDVLIIDHHIREVFKFYNENYKPKQEDVHVEKTWDVVIKPKE